MQIASDTKAFAPTTERDSGANQTTKEREYRSLPASGFLARLPLPALRSHQPDTYQYKLAAVGR